MVDNFIDSLGDRLQQAEMAEREVQRLQPLADEAPQLRVQNAKAVKDEKRRRAKDQAVTKAQASVAVRSEPRARETERGPASWPPSCRGCLRGRSGPVGPSSRPAPSKVRHPGAGG